MRSAAWFKRGLQFGCTACGKCCRSSRTQVFLNENEMTAIATKLDLQLSQFVRQYTVEQENDAGRLLTTLVNKEGAGCIFLGSDKTTCTVYDARPTQCRTYPFWPQNMIGEAEWRAESSRCEGIRIDTSADRRTRSAGGLSPAPLVAPEAIVQEMVISQIHERGVGPNWTYDEAVELLDRTADKTTDLDSFISEFAAKNFSKVIFENARLRVVDVTAVNAMQLDDDGDDDDDSDDGYNIDDRQDGAMGMGVEGHATASTVRHLEFVRSSQLAQTEMLVMPFPSNKVDHGQLVMPIHRLLATVGLNVGSRDAPRVAVLGAGGCALPSYLAHARRGAQISAVEPDLEVLEAASRYFGAKLRYDPRWGPSAEVENKSGTAAADTDQIAACVTDGASFLRDAAHKGVEFDAVLMDAFEMADDCDSDDAAVESRAPPRSLMDAPMLLSCLAPKGIVAINMYGPPAWFDEVRLALCPATREGDEDASAESRSRRFGKPIVLEFCNSRTSVGTSSAAGGRMGANSGSSHPRNAVLIASAEEDTDSLFHFAMNVFQVAQGAACDDVRAEETKGPGAFDGGVGESEPLTTPLTYADIASLTIRD